MLSNKNSFAISEKYDSVIRLHHAYFPNRPAISNVFFKSYFHWIEAMTEILEIPFIDISSTTRVLCTMHLRAKKKFHHFSCSRLCLLAEDSPSWFLMNPLYRLLFRKWIPGFIQTCYLKKKSMSLDKNVKFYFCSELRSQHSETLFNPKSSRRILKTFVSDIPIH